MLNRVVLVGRLTKDPDLRYTPSGVPVATFTLAVNRPFTNQQGEREADFINCVVWRKPAENVANFLKKGSLAGVDGRIQTRHYEGQDGRRVYVTEVVADSVQFLEPKSASRDSSQSFVNNDFPFGSTQNQQKSTEDPFMNDEPFFDNGQPIDVSDDDLPF
jgi:single-strand DNA-binding protein